MFEKLYIGIFIEFVILCCLLTGIEAGHRVRSSSNNELRHFAFSIESNQETEDFKKLLKPLLIPRVSGSDGSLAVQTYIKDHFRALNWQVEEDTFVSDTPIGQKPFTNIMVTHDPTKKEKLTLACHFDSKYMNGKKFIGASDSAVPCAILMDLAAKLNDHLHGKRASTIYDDYTVQILFFDGEEAFGVWTDTDSLYGSRHLSKLWANTPDPADPSRNRLETMSLFALLDLIGPTDVTFRNVFDSSSKVFQNLIKKEKQLKALQPDQTGGGKILFSAESYRGYIDDDHRPFMKLRPDLNVIHLISLHFPKVWHTMDDNEKAINYDVTRRFNQVFRTFVVDFLGLKPSSVGRQ